MIKSLASGVSNAVPEFLIPLPDRWLASASDKGFIRDRKVALLKVTLESVGVAMPTGIVELDCSFWPLETTLEAGKDISLLTLSEASDVKIGPAG